MKISDQSLIQMKERLVKRSEMVPCRSAFIDTHTPGSHLKDNFSIIGPGVTENVEQVINIQEPHGFNIGAAGQPPRIKNSLHSHFTAEVFMIHEGTFDIYWGLQGENHTTLTEGDVVSVPTHCFRGFENIGDKYGFLFTVLGGDDTGGVEWAPQVFEAAEKHGLVLLEEHGVWDTNKAPTPEGSRRVRVMSAEDAAFYDNFTEKEMEKRISRSENMVSFEGNPMQSGEYGPIRLQRIIGLQDSIIPGGDGFELTLLVAELGGGIRSFSRPEKEVLICDRGSWVIKWGGEEENGGFLLEKGDVFSIPPNLPRSFECSGSNQGRLYSVINDDQPSPPEWHF